MSSDHRFALLVILITGGFAVIGYAFKRHVDTQDRRWSEVNRLVLTDAANRATQPVQSDRISRLEAAVVKLSEIVTQIGLQWARHEGYHERTDPHPERLMGTQQNPP